ncbi:MAG TPA: hypothetical protein EYP10_06210, partial [Armatimonadetes bacterium]|nr:hypothetical protein [Armatimonadota bacterium]
MDLPGLREGDFSNWAGDAPTAKRVWEMPTGSVRSWVACGEHLRFSCMIEAPCDKGVIIASQLRIGAKLDIEPVAQRLLANMLRYCDAYRPPTRRTLIHAPQMKTIVNFIRRIGVKAYEAQALSDALSERDAILVVHASRRNLMALLRMRNAVNEFVNRGGWIMLWGLEPDGLDAFNALLGTRHLIREFRLERPEIVPDALTAGLGNRDVVQYSTEELMHRDRWLSMDTFTYCVDGADIAPFCHLPYQREGQYRPLKNDKDPFNLVNGMTGHDFWRDIL